MEPIYLAPVLLPIIGVLMAVAGADLTDPRFATELKKERDND